MENRPHDKAQAYLGIMVSLSTNQSYSAVLFNPCVTHYPACILSMTGCSGVHADAYKVLHVEPLVIQTAETVDALPFRHLFLRCNTHTHTSGLYSQPPTPHNPSTAPVGEI